MIYTVYTKTPKGRWVRNGTEQTEKKWHSPKTKKRWEILFRRKKLNAVLRVAYKKLKTEKISINGSFIT